MGCAYSRSEDLTMPERALHNEESNGYFRQTLQTPMDYIIKSGVIDQPNEMSYHGPPSHLQNSVDVHPFWHFYGRDYVPTERFRDMSQEKPASLLPAAETAQELRTIELQETMQSLRKQVAGVITKKTTERKAAAKVVEESNHRLYQLTKEEQSTLDFLEATLNDFDDTCDMKDTPYNSLVDSNMNLHRKNPVQVDDSLIVNPKSRIGTRVHQNAMYLPDISISTRQNIQDRIHLQNIETDNKTQKNLAIRDTHNMNAINVKNINDNVIRRQSSKNNVNIKPLTKSYIEEKPEKEKLERRASSVRDLVRMFSVKSEKKKIDSDFINEEDKSHICGEYKELNNCDENDNINIDNSKPGSSRRKSIDDMSDDSAIVTETLDLVDKNFTTTQTVVKGHKKLTESESTLTQKSIDSGIA
ncbi:uncharacterized protein [Antedon mediterranea]|uniref:uncharacterized protein n=1 Tax=Antedon mediterranea TaxID=105859 RepID=UPI003AF44AF4